MIQNKRRHAEMSTEVAIGVTLAVVAVIVGIGLFSDNIASVASESGLANLFNGNGAKTQYDSTKVDLSKNNVEVQIMGEQGLQMLRRKANNKAIEIIDESFSNKNQNANSIGYLATAIVALSGEPHICAYMQKDSDEHCNKLGGYNYTINESGTALTINKVNAAGSTVSSSINLNIDSAAAALLGSKTISTDGNGNSTLTESQKYDYIKDLSVRLASYVRSDVILINFAAATNSTEKSKYAKRPLIKKAMATFSNIANSVPGVCHGICWTSHWGKGDRNAIIDWANNGRAQFVKMQASDTTDVNPNKVFAEYVKNTLTADIINHANRKKGNEACRNLGNPLVDFALKYSVPLEDMGITVSGNRYTIDRGSTCSWTR